MSNKQVSVATGGFRLGCVYFLLGWCMPLGSALAQDKAQDDPFKARGTPAAAAAPEPTDPNAPWNVRVPTEVGERVTLGAPGCPVVVSGKQVWNIRQGRIVCELDTRIDQNALAVLSDDGKYFAAALKSANQEGTAVRVWSTETGARLLEIPGVPKRYVDLMVFSLNKYLILGGRSTPDFQVWDIEQAKAIAPINVNAYRIERGKAAFSADGKFFLAIVNKKLTLFKTATGKPVTVMSPPHRLDAGPPPAPANSGAPKPTSIRPARRNANAPSPSPAANSDDAYFIYVSMDELRFSPDGKEIAALSTLSSPQLIVWDINGKLLYHELLGIQSLGPDQFTLQWLPDKSGWLVGGLLIDRESKRAILEVHNKTRWIGRVALLDQDHLIGSFPDDPMQLRSYEIPWKQIRQSVTLMRDPTATLLKPSQPVSIKAELADEGGGDGNQTSATLVDALTQRLKRNGLSVAAGQDMVFHLKFSEKTGDTLPIYEKKSPFELQGRDTGRTIAERKGSLIIELTTSGQTAPVWRATINANSERSFREAINDNTVRKSMLDAAVSQIRTLNIPYFIPRNEQNLALPVVLQ
jgi:hypothetical protein